MRTTKELISLLGADPFTLRQAIAIGLSRSAVRHACASGVLLHLARDLYQAPTAGQDLLDKIRAAALRHPDAIFTHSAAAALHQMWCPRPGGWNEVVGSMQTYGCKQAQMRLMKRKIDTLDMTDVAGLRCTTPARTALDIAAQSTLPEGLVVVDSYGRLKHPTRKQTLDPVYRDQVRRELLAVAVRMRHLRGIGRARIAASLANPAAESAPESYARGLFITDGHQEPLVGQPIRGADSRTYYVDLLWPATREVVEIDGAAKYQTRHDLIAEKRREDTIRAAGYRVRRIMAGDLWTTGIATTGRQAA